MCSKGVPREVPEGLERYARSPIKEDGFRRGLREYLNQQQLSVALDDTLIGSLFRIVLEGTISEGIASGLRQPSTKKDWAKRERLIRTIVKEVRQVGKLLDNYRGRELPATAALAGSLRNGLKTFEDDLEMADVRRRAAAGWARAVKGTKFPQEVTFALHHCLGRALPGSSQHQRYVIIAGCLIAGRFYTKREAVDLDIVSAVATQISRARKDIMREAGLAFEMEHWPE